MDEVYDTYAGDLTFMTRMTILIMLLMMRLTMILMMILMMIRMMITILLGAGTCIQSRLKDQGPCLGTSEHHRRDADVILRQSKAPIEIFNSRWVPLRNIDVGRCFATNEQPRRDTDVISRQAKALIEIFNSRWVPWLNSWSKWWLVTKQWTYMIKKIDVLIILDLRTI